MTTNQTIDGVPRELIDKAMLACFEAGFGIPHAELRALLDSAPCAKSQAEPDPALCKFYDVSDWYDLVRELVGHVDLLQESAKRNVKPWEDTFPPTLLPAYIERVNAENAAAQPQGEPVALAQGVGVLTFMRSTSEDANRCACCEGDHVFCRYFEGLPDFNDLTQDLRHRNDLEGREFRVTVELLAEQTAAGSGCAA
jgi:hypothetical protein